MYRKLFIFICFVTIFFWFSSIVRQSFAEIKDDDELLEMLSKINDELMLKEIGKYLDEANEEKRAHPKDAQFIREPSDDEHEEDDDFSLNFNVGEKVLYSVRTLNMKVPGMKNAVVAFNVDKRIYDGKECYVFNAVAKGGGFGYNLILATESFIDSKSFYPVLFTNTQTGSEVRKHKLVFSDDKIEYVKMKHCKSFDDCSVDAHYKKKRGAKVHCKGCDDRNHYKWRVRSVHNNEKPTYDLLSALFVARTFDIHVGGKNAEMVLVDGRDLWKMKIRPVSEETIETPAGSFDTILVVLESMPFNDHAKKQDSFRGLFGLKGDIKLWIDKVSKTIIKITGSYPLVFDIKIEIKVKSIESGVVKLTNAG